MDLAPIDLLGIDLAPKDLVQIDLSPMGLAQKDLVQIELLQLDLMLKDLLSKILSPKVVLDQLQTVELDLVVPEVRQIESFEILLELVAELAATKVFVEYLEELHFEN